MKSTCRKKIPISPCCTKFFFKKKHLCDEQQEQQPHLHPGDPVHAHDSQPQDEDKGDGADEPDVVDPHPDDAVEVGESLLQHVHQGLAEADQVHGDGDGVGQGEHEADGAAELGAERPCKKEIHSWFLMFKNKNYCKLFP